MELVEGRDQESIQDMIGNVGDGLGRSERGFRNAEDIEKRVTCFENCIFYMYCIAVLRSIAESRRME